MLNLRISFSLDVIQFGRHYDLISPFPRFFAFDFSFVVLQPLFNLMALAFGIVFAWLSQSLFGTFLDWGSRFVIAFGFFVVLDPIAVLVVDVAMWNFEFGDAFKLYNHFFFEEGNGILGIFLVCCSISFNHFVIHVSDY